MSRKTARKTANAMANGISSTATRRSETRFQSPEPTAVAGTATLSFSFAATTKERRRLSGAALEPEHAEEECREDGLDTARDQRRAGDDDPERVAVVQPSEVGF